MKKCSSQKLSFSLKPGSFSATGMIPLFLAALLLIAVFLFSGCAAKPELGTPANTTGDTLSYDGGHEKLQGIMDSLHEQSTGLERGDYFGYQYATGQLYKYLLAINYQSEDLLDANYKYSSNFASFEELCRSYHGHVDFTSLELANLVHENFEIFVELAYTDKLTNNTRYLVYHLNYGEHGIADKTVFN
ncbi:MAG: hypothetical protein AB1796_12610 [Bacillota bacterium]